MDQRQNQQRGIEETRERVGLLAGELASRANPPYVKARVKEFAEAEAEIAKDAAMRKAMVVKEDVKEAAMKKAVEVKGRVMGSPITYSLLGALGGWLLGAFIGKRMTPRLQAGTPSYEHLDFGGPITSTPDLGEGTGESVGERASEAYATAKDKASAALTSAKDKATDTFAAAKDKVGSTVSQVRQKVPSAHEISDRTSGFIHTTASTRPLIFALVPLCLGALFAFLLPMSAKERSALSTAKHKLNAQLSALGERVEERIAAGPGQKTDQQPTNAAPLQTAAAEAEIPGMGV